MSVFRRKSSRDRGLNSSAKQLFETTKYANHTKSYTFRVVRVFRGFLPPALRGSTFHRLGGSFEDELVESQVEPAAELKAGLANRARVMETEALVQPDADAIL